MSQTAGPSSKPLFVTFEGGEGSGKSTQIERAAAFLRGQGRSVTVTREPGGSPGADALRHILLSGQAREAGPESEAVLFAAARSDHVATLIRPALLRGEDVLCDRFVDSTRVYQGLAGVDPALIALLEEASLHGGLPDLTLVLDVPAETGLLRAARRRGAAEADRFEGEAADLHEARRGAFLTIARAETHRCRIVDASQDLDAVAAEIEAALAERLQGLDAVAAEAPA